MKDYNMALFAQQLTCALKYSGYLAQPMRSYLSMKDSAKTQHNISSAAQCRAPSDKFYSI